MTSSCRMEHFVATVQPGAMYIHDIDTGYLSESHEAWLMRCPKCRERFPSDEMAHPQGQAGAIAGWFRKVCDRLSQVPPTSAYHPARTQPRLHFTRLHPLPRPGQPKVWREESIFRVPSSLWAAAPEWFGSRAVPRPAAASVSPVSRGPGGVATHGSTSSLLRGETSSARLVNASCSRHLFEVASSVCLPMAASTRSRPSF